MVKHSSAGTRGAGTSTFSFPASPPIPPPPTHHTIPHTSTDVKADMRPVQEIEVFQLGVSFKFVYVLQCVFFLHVKEGGGGVKGVTGESVFEREKQHRKITH